MSVNFPRPQIILLPGSKRITEPIWYSIYLNLSPRLLSSSLICKQFFFFGVLLKRGFFNCIKTNGNKLRVLSWKYGAGGNRRNLMSVGARHILNYRADRTKKALCETTPGNPPSLFKRMTRPYTFPSTALP